MSAEEETRLARALHDSQLREWCTVLGHGGASRALLPALGRLYPEISRVVHRAARTGEVEHLAARIEPLDLDRAVLSRVESWFLGEKGEVVLHRPMEGRIRRRFPPAVLSPLAVDEGMASARRALRAQRACTEAIRSRFVVAHDRLVAGVVSRYRATGIARDDLEQEAHIGLLKAVQRYDPESGNRFFTYARWWVRHACQRAAARTSRPVRLPARWHSLIVRMKKWESEFHGTHGRDPRPEELADRLGTDVSVVHEVRDPCLDTMLSLERPLVDDGDSLHDILADPATRSPDETLEVVQRDRALMDALVELGGRDARILRLRYGIDDGGRDGRSLQAIGDLYGISRERVRQIESRALAGLRAILAGGDPG